MKEELSSPAVMRTVLGQAARYPGSGATLLIPEDMTSRSTGLEFSRKLL